jgi:hypothetical protein
MSDQPTTTPKTTTTKAAPAPAPAEAPGEPPVSRQAQFSTYTVAPTDKEAENPPPGPSVEQTLGPPEEASE